MNQNQLLRERALRLANLVGGDVSEVLRQLCAALSQPEQEGEVVYQLKVKDGRWIDQSESQYHYNKAHECNVVRILYTAPPASQEQAQQPFAYMADDVAAGVIGGQGVLLSAAIRGAPGGTFNFPRYAKAQHPTPAAVPMTPEQMRALQTEAGYDDANVQARADFINGARYAERHHNITKD